MPESRLYGSGLTLAYDQRVVVSGLDVTILDHSFTAIIRPNACGKSTLLRALSRLLKPRQGAVFLDGKAITSRPPKDVARRLGLLPQTSVAPDGITVADPCPSPDSHRDHAEMARLYGVSRTISA